MGLEWSGVDISWPPSQKQSLLKTIICGFGSASSARKSAWVDSTWLRASHCVLAVFYLCRICVIAVSSLCPSCVLAVS